MFANLVQLITGRPATGTVDRHGFVAQVEVKGVERRNPKVERLILICWILIAIKHVGIIWICHRYPVPFHQLWVNFPTWLLGVLATALYYGQAKRR